ncbi:MAG: 3-hydroxyacyl-ACP dehydratase [Marinilabiliales bacterium]|nr:MAG: 3-hydroxyacyl-ACP dehydratase [Marinilabiliales bacterium]
MLLKNFYTLAELDNNDKENVMAIVDLNKNHEVYQGHFPGNPIVPGVCLTQIIKEVMEKSEGKDLRLVYADNIKFMAIVNPEVNSRLQIDLKVKYDQEQNLIKVNSVTHFNDQVFYKFKGNFKPK